MSEARFLAADLGAESGRVMLGTLAQGRLQLEELHRFLNEPVQLPTGLYWDAFRLFRDIVHGIKIAGRERKLSIDGIGVDTWGVDFGLLGLDGDLVDNPRCYRDRRTDGQMERTFARLPKERIFARTGLQFMQFNSLFQLHAGAEAARRAALLLFMPDLLNYWLTGVSASERTIASTSQFYDPQSHTWAADLLEGLAIPTRILPELIDTGHRLGRLLPHLADAAGLDAAVYATAGHDTGAAVAAVPAESGSWCYISSGTWSLMGVELAAPIVNEQCLKLNFTNEVGFGGTIRLLKNIMGMWPLQECRRAWLAAGQEYSYANLVEMAAAAPAFAAVIDPDAFLHPGHMPERIAEYCRTTGQSEPAQPGGMARVIMESLALRYRQVLESLETLTGRRIDTIHIVGGGSRNALLNQFVADATSRTVVAGPDEATAIGNVLIQAIGAGMLKDLAALRAVVRASYPVTSFTPKNSGAWEQAYERFLSLPRQA